jgi:hypothetical protein
MNSAATLHAVISPVTVEESSPQNGKNKHAKLNS